MISITTQHDDFWEMLNDIRAHIKNTGVAVKSSDKPKQLKFGIATMNNTHHWEIGLAHFRRSIQSNHITQEQCRMYNLFRTADGRDELCQQLYDKATV